MTYAGDSPCLPTWQQYQVQEVGREEVSAFSPSNPFPAGTAQERMPDKEFRNSMGRSQFTPLWTVTTKTRIFKVAKPIKVRIYSEDNLFFAENETLVIIGTGSSAMEAMDDFCRHIIHFYHYYKKLSWDKSTGDAVRLKKLYETLFIEQE